MRFYSLTAPNFVRRSELFDARFFRIFSILLEKVLRPPFVISQDVLSYGNTFLYVDVALEFLFEESSLCISIIVSNQFRFAHKKSEFHSSFYRNSL